MTDNAAVSTGMRDVDTPAAAHASSLIVYFVMTFALAWTLWLIAAFATATAGFGIGLRALFFLPGTFAPAIVALTLSARDRTRRQTAELLNGLVRWQVRARWYIFALGFMAAVKLTAAAAHRIGTGAWPIFGDVPLYLLLLGAVFSTPVQAGEEIGWRGYALPRLASLTGFPAASLLLGLVWALWHLPLFLLARTDSTGQPFLLFVVSVTALSVAMTLLYVRTERSLLLLMLMHAAVNNTTGIVPASLPTPPGAWSLSAPPIAWFTIAVLWTAALVFLLRLRGPARPSPDQLRNASRTPRGPTTAAA